MQEDRLPCKAWEASIKLQKIHRSKIMCTCWGVDIRKWFDLWNVGAYLGLSPQKVNITELQFSQLNTLQTERLTTEKRTKLEYYQDHTNPSCWSTYTTIDDSVQLNISTPIPLLYRRNIAHFHTRSHTFAIERNASQNLLHLAKVCRLCDLHVVETEEHVAIQCPRCAHIRANFNSLVGDSTQLLPILSTAPSAAMGALVTRLFLYHQDLETS